MEKPFLYYEKYSRKGLKRRIRACSASVRMTMDEGGMERKKAEGKSLYQKKKESATYAGREPGKGIRKSSVRLYTALLQRQRCQKKISVLHKRSGEEPRGDIADDGIYGETLHEPAELFRGEPAQILRIPRPGEMAGFHALIQKQETVAFPKEAFDL